jgi:very-short-patch-repair endonuclease
MTRALVERAREFRASPTSSEALLWDALRDRRLDGVKIRRQMVIGAFVVDFCAPRHHLVVELDGAVHTTQEERDNVRQQLLEASGYRVLCVSAEAVATDLPKVLAMIAAHLNTSRPPLHRGMDAKRAVT